MQLYYTIVTAGTPILRFNFKQSHLYEICYGTGSHARIARRGLTPLLRAIGCVVQRVSNMSSLK